MGRDVTYLIGKKKVLKKVGKKSGQLKKVGSKKSQLHFFFDISSFKFFLYINGYNN